MRGGPTVPSREKTAWLSLIAMAITFGPYFTLVSLRPHPEAGLPNLRQIGLFAATVSAQALILFIDRLFPRHKSPEEARTPPDERDQAIERRSIGSACYVLIAGMILVGCVMPFSSGRWTIINAAIFMIVVAEVVHHGVVVTSYRRQA
jgi:cytochrome b561